MERCKTLNTEINQMSKNEKLNTANLRDKVIDNTIRMLRLFMHGLSRTHYVYTQKDGQAELTWVADYISIKINAHKLLLIADA